MDFMFKKGGFIAGETAKVIIIHLKAFRALAILLESFDIQILSKIATSFKSKIKNLNISFHKY